MRRIIFLISGLVLSGCATPQGPKFEMPKTEVRNTQSRLVLYRTGLTPIMRSNTSVLLDGGTICYIEPGEVMVRDIKPGSHKLAVDTPNTPGTSTISFDAEPGKTTYVVASPNGARIARALLLGYLAPVVDYAVSDKTSNRGGALVIEMTAKEEAEQAVSSMHLCDCAPPES